MQGVRTIEPEAPVGHERLFPRILSALAATALAALAVGMASAWAGRQVRDENVWLWTLEPAGLLGLLVAVLAAPVAVADCSRAGNARAARVVSAGLLVLAAVAVTYALRGDFAASRFYFFPQLTLLLPAVMLAGGFLLAIVASVGGRASVPAQAEYKRCWFPVLVLGASVAWIFLAGPADESVDRLLGQVWTNAWLHDDFAALLLFAAMLGAGRALIRETPAASGATGVAATVVAGMAGCVQPADNAAPVRAPLAIAASLLPIGLLLPAMGFVAGVRMADSMLAGWLLTLPVAVIGAGAAFVARQSNGTRERKDAWLIVAVLVAALGCAAFLVIGSYARPLEAMALAVVGCLGLLVLAVVIRRQPIGVSWFLTSAVAAAGHLALWLLAAASLYVAFDSDGMLERLLASIRSADPGAAAMAGFMAAVALALPRRLALLDVALLLLPPGLALLTAAGLGTAESVCVLALVIGGARSVSAGGEVRFGVNLLLGLPFLLLALVIAARVMDIGMMLRPGRFW